jgi:ribosomal protein S6
MEKDGENQKIYELGYILLPTIPEDKLNDEVSNITKIIETKGSVVSSEMPKSRKLEYSMSKVVVNKKTSFESGYFGFVIFNTDSEGILDIKASLENDENILRFILLNRSKSSFVVREKRAQSNLGPNENTDKKVLDTKPKGIKIDEEKLDKSIEELITN